MKEKKIIKKLNYQPTRLQEHQLKDPLKVMSYFFHDFPIHQTRENLLELHKGWVYNSAAYTDEKMTTDMLCFMTQFTEFLDACYVFTEKNQPKDE